LLGRELTHPVADERLELSVNPAGEGQRKPLLRSPNDLGWQWAIESAEEQPLVTEERTVTSQPRPHRPKKLVIDKWHSDFQAVRHAHHVDIA